jgi:virginiamycin B lyase
MAQVNALKWRMRAVAAGALLLAAGAGWAQQVSMTVFPAAPGSQPSVPLATRDGSLWYSGQANTLGRIDPKTGQVREYALRTPRSAPQGLAEDRQGNIWFAASAAAGIGKLDPRSGAITEYRLPEGAGNPHTLLLGPGGAVWFTAENANQLGRLDARTGEVRLLDLPTPGARPQALVFDPRGNVFVALAGSNGVVMVTPSTLQVREYKLPDPAARPRRIAVTPDNQVWYTDDARGMIGRVDLADGDVKEWPSPGGPKSAPSGLAAIGPTLWYSEAGATPNTVVRFDPATQVFQSWPLPGGGQSARNTAVTTEGDLVLANSVANAVTLVKIGR